MSYSHFCISLFGENTEIARHLQIHYRMCQQSVDRSLKLDFKLGLKLKSLTCVLDLSVKLKLI